MVLPCEADVNIYNILISIFEQKKEHNVIIFI